jgi:hypothetical protein
MEQQAGHHRALPMDRLAAEHCSIQGTKLFLFLIFPSSKSSTAAPILYLPLIFSFQRFDHLPLPCSNRITTSPFFSNRASRAAVSPPKFEGHGQSATNLPATFQRHWP